MESIQMTIGQLEALFEGDFRAQCEGSLQKIREAFGDEPFTVKVKRNSRTTKVHYAFVQTVFDFLELGGIYPIVDGTVMSLDGDMELPHLNHYTGITFLINRNL